jgi:CDP-glycerol glycerophosphotransferase
VHVPPPTLSVVVPVFDVESYVSPCLESLVNQHLADIEIIVVDDGSTDGSRAVAERWARGDPRIRVICQANSGLSATRNAGIRVARGRYLAFCDSDDVVPATAYASLVGSLEATGSDFATGDVRRLHSSGLRPHSRYQDAFARDRRRTHILRHTALVRDRMVWNKVFRRAFWDAHGLSFTLPTYEDGPVMIRAHIEASAVDVLSEVVYLWRIREHGPLSISQREGEPENLAALMRMVFDTFEIIATLAGELVPAYAHDMCSGDVPHMLRGLLTHDEAALSDALSFARSFVARVPDDVLAALPTTHRQLMTHLVLGELEEIRRLLTEPSP